MDPYLEDPARWPDVHLSLIAELRAELNARLRPRFVVRAEERVYVAAAGEETEPPVRPDLTVLARPGADGPVEGPTGSGRAASPVVIPTVVDEERRERYLVVRAADSGTVVTVIEVLSPTNKRGPGSAGRRAYVAKRREVLASEAHLVEVDLLREGARVPMAAPLPGADYFVIVSRAERRPACEVYPVALRDPLPVVAVPLTPDEDVEVDLQAMLARAYERGGYDLDVDYRRDPVPPLGGDDAAWARERVEAWLAGG